MAVVLPFLELVHKIKRQIRQLRLQLAADALRLLVERGAAFRKTALGVGTLFRRAAHKLLVRRGKRRRAGFALPRFLGGTLVGETVQLGFTLDLRLRLCLACRLDLCAALVHKGQHRLEKQLFQDQHQRQKA